LISLPIISTFTPTTTRNNGKHPNFANFQPSHATIKQKPLPFQKLCNSHAYDRKRNLKPLLTHSFTSSLKTHAFNPSISQKIPQPMELHAKNPRINQVLSLSASNPL
jgi:hypothetical protein